MTFDEIKDLLVKRFGPEVIEAEETTGLQPALIIRKDRITAVCLELRTNDQTYFDFLSCLSAVDHGLEENKMSVVYHLASIPYKTQLTLKVVQEFDRTSGSLPICQSVSSVWKTAEWHEREAYDLLGVFFDGNPDLRRILLPDDWEGYPLRKDYKTAAEYNGIKIDF
ncbi:NADH-quinone oxidoreductase subunit C [Pedobacter sp. HMF7647]|uniref:NADH-quinone oxidoreductase subunit C n=1 Tax=Hufsiella arboris TaxID=2695275 RepID=A0A7K1YA25_9SPHI|nr:NADH-quinone oxidoreductase subunit C [Hufsiella arboris]MXV51191.1 NADH-quinone oxidoreductase subunit C [Hufsiella arboris]